MMHQYPKLSSITKAVHAGAASSMSRRFVEMEVKDRGVIKVVRRDREGKTETLHQESFR